MIMIDRLNWVLALLSGFEPHNNRTIWPQHVAPGLTL